MKIVENIYTENHAKDANKNFSFAWFAYFAVHKFRA
jgi:hypothetical protein